MEEKKIRAFLKKAKRRIWTNLFLHSFLLYLGAGLLLGTFINVVALIFPVYNAVYYAALVALVVTLIGIVVMIVKAPNKEKVALIVDKTGLQEQLVTSLELEGKDDTISMLQKQKTCKSIATYSLKEHFPIRCSFGNVMLAALAAMAFIIGAMMPSPAKQQAVANHNLKELAKKEAKKIEEVKEELKKSDKVTKSEAEEYEKLLKEALEELKKTENKSDLNKAKERLETKLEKKLSQNSSTSAKEVEKMLEEKKLIQKTAQEKEEQKIKEQVQKELAKLEKNLKDNKKNGTSDEENSSKVQGNTSNENMVSNNQQQQNASTENMLSLTQQMNNAVQNNCISSQNMQSLLPSLQQANNASSNGNNGKMLQQLSNQMTSMLSNSSGNQAMASNDATMSASNGGQGQLSMFSQGNEKNGSNGNGGGTGGSGSGKGTGSGNGSGGGGYNYGSKKGMERELDLSNSEENVAIPNGAVGKDSNLTGKKTGNNQYTQKSSDSLTWAGNSVNYNQVVGNYAQKAYSNLENSNIPASMKDVVKAYFEGLTQ